MEISRSYTMKRGQFGKQPQFCEVGPEMCDSIPTAVAEHKNYMLRNPVNQATQNTKDFSVNQINTIRAEYTTSGANHAEGGWPKDVIITDPEATQRYRRKIEKDDGYIHCINATAEDMDHYAHQNNAIDMYSIYYAEMVPTAALERISCRTVNEYRDPPPTRPISSICWQPDGGSKFVAAYNDIDVNRSLRAPLLSYIWDVENSNSPETTITPPSPLIDLTYNSREPTTLAGGLLNGQVGVWDRRLGGNAQLVTPPHTAHRDLVRNVIFVNAKSGQEFFSAGTDGTCKWWDIRKMEEPLEEMILDPVKSHNEEQTMANANGVSVLEFEPTMPTRFMVGTENGLVLGVNRKGKTPMEKIPARFEAHSGTVWSLERNPGFLKNFLTVGDWTARVWSEDCRESAVLWTPPHRHKITAGTWSPTRISLMLLVQANGVLGVWDLLRRHHEPVLSMQVCDEPLIRMRMHEGGSLLACGSQQGSVYMVELSQSLSQSDKTDKGLMTLILEREAKRERILEARMREIKLKIRQAEEGSPATSLTDVDHSLGDKDLHEAALEYMTSVKKEQNALT